MCKIILNIFTFTVGNNFLNLQQIGLSFFFSELSKCNFKVRLHSRCMSKNLIFSVIEKA